MLLRLADRGREPLSGDDGYCNVSSLGSREESGFVEVLGDGGEVWMSGRGTLGTRGGDMRGGSTGIDGGGFVRSLKAGSGSKSQLKLSRNPRRSVVSDGENRSAEGRSGIDEGGKRLDKAGSKAYSKSAKGTGG